MPFAELCSANQSPQAKGGGGAKEIRRRSESEFARAKKSPATGKPQDPPARGGDRQPPQGGATGNPREGGGGVKL